jgi:hypothetical protein
LLIHNNFRLPLANKAACQSVDAVWNPQHIAVSIFGGLDGIATNISGALKWAAARSPDARISLAQLGWAPHHSRIEFTTAPRYSRTEFASCSAPLTH